MNAAPSLSTITKASVIALVLFLIIGTNDPAYATSSFNSVRSGLKVEYVPANFASATDGQLVSTDWPDSSGHQNDLPVGPGDHMVTYIASGFGGKPVLRMDSMTTGGNFDVAATQAIPFAPGTGDFSLTLILNTPRPQVDGSNRNLMGGATYHWAIMKEAFRNSTEPAFFRDRVYPTTARRCPQLPEQATHTAHIGARA